MKWFTYQTGYTKKSKFVLLLSFTNITTVLCFVIYRTGSMKDLGKHLYVLQFFLMQFKIEGRVRISLKGEEKL